MIREERILKPRLYLDLRPRPVFWSLLELQSIMDKIRLKKMKELLVKIQTA